jgi:hypothetical protein
LHELGDAYADVLAEHRRALREAFVRHGGVEVDTQGDAFFVAFAKARDASAAANDARRALDGGPIRVRMGLHTGEPVVTEEGYVGIDVHRAARIASAGHGGQILVSHSTRQLVQDDALRDLGEHRLKDLTAPERIYQLGDGDFPPLKSLNSTNLPVASSALIGRKKELQELHALLLDGARAVTLTGPGRKREDPARPAGSPRIWSTIFPAACSSSRLRGSPRPTCGWQRACASFGRLERKAASTRRFSSQLSRLSIEAILRRVCSCTPPCGRRRPRARTS